jgi:hypothetical protein
VPAVKHSKANSGTRAAQKKRRHEVGANVGGERITWREDR